MNIGISGPPNCNKTRIAGDVANNEWFVKNGYNLIRFTSTSAKITPTTELERSHYQSFLYNDHISALVTTNSNRILDTTILDVLAHSYLHLDSGNMSSRVVESLTSNILSNIHRYHLIYVFIPSENDYAPYYSTACTLLSLQAPDVIKTISLDIPVDNDYNHIIEQIVEEAKDKYTKAIKFNEQNSNKWFSMYGQDYFGGSTEEASKV